MLPQWLSVRPLEIFPLALLLYLFIFIKLIFKRLCIYLFKDTPALDKQIIASLKNLNSIGRPRAVFQRPLSHASQWALLLQGKSFAGPVCSKMEELTADVCGALVCGAPVCGGNSVLACLQAVVWVIHQWLSFHGKAQSPAVQETGCVSSPDLLL